MADRGTLVYCDCLAPEVEELLKRPPFSGVHAIRVKGECDRPPYTNAELAALIEGEGGVLPALALGSDCILKRDGPPSAAGFRAHELRRCLEQLAGREWLERRLAAGDHVSTLAQVLDWEQAYARWGFDAPTAREYFAESTRRLVLLDSGLDPHSSERLRAFAAQVDRPWSIRHVELGGLEDFLTGELERLELERRIDRLASEKMDAEQRLADFGMIQDLAGALTAFTEEDAVAERLRELFQMLCAPHRVRFCRAGDDACRSLPPGDDPLPPALASGRHRIHEGRDGFDLALERGGQRFGLVSVEGIAFPARLEHYLNLSLNLAPVLALALSNARTYQERLEAEQRVEALNAELKQRLSQVNALNRELETFTYSVSHDLRTPLRSLDGFSHILARDYPEALDERGRHFLERIRANARRMGQLIDDLLRLSRLTRGELNLEPLDLAAMVRELADDLRQTAPEREVRFVAAETMPVRADARLMRSLLENLIGNAWKYTGKTQTPCIEIGMDIAEGEACYYVRDNGAGFDMAYADKLFMPFQRLHSEEEFEGSGVGLATVQRIVQRHGGRIWAEAAPGQGATFFFTLGNYSDRYAKTRFSHATKGESKLLPL